MKTLLTFFMLSFALNSFANEKMVIGKDDRHQIKAKNKEEVHESIGLLIKGNGKKGEFCTATIIGPRHIITATHCIGSGNNLHFIPGQMNWIATRLEDRLPKAAIRAKRAYPFPGFSSQNQKQTDLSVIIFEEDFLARPIPFALFDHIDETVTVTGYPSDKKLGTMWEDSGIISGEGTYTLDTFGGQSGSAVRNKNNEIIGIHIYSNEKFKINQSVVFKQEHIDFINEHLKKN